MILRIVGIRDAGIFDKERALFFVEEEGDLGRYITATSIDLGESISSSISNPMWFPDKKVKAGDLIVVYTKNGRNTSVNNADKSKSWFFYRGSKGPLFADSSTSIVVFEISNWLSSIKRF